VHGCAGLIVVLGKKSENQYNDEFQKYAHAFQVGIFKTPCWKLRAAQSPPQESPFLAYFL
jgi:hypothetical protein